MINSFENTLTLTSNCDKHITVPFLDPSNDSPTTTPAEVESCKALVTESIILEPFTENIVSVYPAQNIFRYTLLLEGSPDIVEEYHSPVAHSLPSGLRDEIPCRILNPSPTRILLPANLPIAIVLVFDDTLPSLTCNINALQTQHPQNEVTFNIDDENTTAEDKATLLEFLQRKPDVFASSDSELGCTPVLEHHIDVGNAKPIKSTPYRTNPGTQLQLQEHIQDMLSNDIIQESNSSWAAPNVLVSKIDGSSRFVAILGG